MSLPAIIGYDRARKLSVAAIVGYVLVMIALFVAACVTGGCGAAPLGAAASCAGMYVAIGEHDYPTAARARADLDQVTEVCDRLAVDAGTAAP